MINSVVQVVLVPVRAEVIIREEPVLAVPVKVATNVVITWAELHFRKVHPLNQLAQLPVVDGMNDRAKKVGFGVNHT